MRTTSKLLNIVLLLLLADSLWGSQPGAELLAKFRLKRQLYHWFHQQMRVSSNNLNLELASAELREGSLIVDGQVNFRTDEFKPFDGGLLQGVSLTVEVGAKELAICNSHLDLQSWMIQDQDSGNANLNLVIVIDELGVRQMTKNLLIHEPRVKSFELELGDQIIQVKTQVGGGFGGVAMELDLGVEHQEHKLLFVKRDLRLRAWGFGKAKVSEVRDKLEELLSLASVKLPKELLLSFPKLKIRQWEVSKEGLYLHLSQGILQAAEFKLAKAP